MDLGKSVCPCTLYICKGILKMVKIGGFFEKISVKMAKIGGFFEKISVKMVKIGGF